MNPSSPIPPPINFLKAMCYKCVSATGRSSDERRIITTQRPCVRCQEYTFCVLPAQIGYRRRLCNHCADTTSVAGMPVQREQKKEDAGRCTICNDYTHWIVVAELRKLEWQTPTQEKKEEEETPTMKFPLTFSVNTIKTIEGHKGQFILSTERQFLPDLEDDSSGVRIAYESPAYESERDAATDVLEHIERLLD